MNNSLTLTPFADPRKNVLRNTYLLLALSLLPTVAGAWLGIATSMTGFGGFLFLLAVSLGLIFAIEKYKNSAAGVPLLLAFTFFMGLTISHGVGAVLGTANGASVVMAAFGGTAGVLVVMAFLANVIKRDMSGMGKWLLGGLLVLIVASVVNVFVGSTLAMAAISTVSIALFSAFLLYDLKQVIDGGETSYVSATLAVYLNLLNIFTSLLQLIGLVDD